MEALNIAERRNIDCKQPAVDVDVSACRRYNI